MKHLKITLHLLCIVLLVLVITIGLYICLNPEKVREWNDRFNNTKSDLIQKEIELTEHKKYLEQARTVRINFERYSKK